MSIKLKMSVDGTNVPKNTVTQSQCWCTDPGVVFRTDRATGALYAAFVRPNSPAALAGIKRCTSIISLNNVPATRLSADDANVWTRKLLAKFSDDQPDISGSILQATTTHGKNPLLIVYGQLLFRNADQTLPNDDSCGINYTACDQLLCLKQVVLSTEGTHFCNACAQSQSDGSIVFGCRRCDWDLCNKCYLDAKSYTDNLSVPDSVAHSPTMVRSTELCTRDGGITKQTQMMSPQKWEQFDHSGKNPPSSAENQSLQSTIRKSSSTSTNHVSTEPMSPLRTIADDKATSAIKRVQERRKFADAKRKEQEAAEAAREEALALQLRTQVSINEPLVSCA